MSTTEVRAEHGLSVGGATLDLKLEVVVIPVSDVDRSKESTLGLAGGWWPSRSTTALGVMCRREPAAYGASKTFTSAAT